MSRTDKAIKGILTSFLQYGCQIVLQILLAPLVLTVAGQEILGAYALIMQAIAYLAMTDLGFSLALTRFLSQAFGREDNGQYFEIVLTTTRTIFLFTNSFFAFLLILFALFSNDLFSFSQSTDLQAKWSLSLFAFWVLARTPLMIYREGLNASQNMSSANLIGIFGNVTRLLFSLGLVAIGMGLIGLILANIIGEALILYLCAKRFQSIFSKINPQWGLPDRDLLRKMFAFGKHAILINLARRLVSGTDHIVVGLLRGAAATSIYYTTQMPTVIGYLLVNMLVDNVGPAINELYAKKEFAKLNELFFRMHRYVFLLASLLFTGILLLNKTMIIVWVGEAQYAGDLMSFSLAAFALLHVVGHVSWVFIIAIGDLRQLSKFALYEGLVNLLLSFLLGYRYGLSGVMLATLIAHVPMAFYLQYRGMAVFGMHLHQYAKFIILPVIIPCSLATISAFVVRSSIPIDGWLSFGCSASVLFIVHAGLSYVISIDKSERVWIQQKISGTYQSMFA